MAISFAQTVLLGAVAGFTVYLGLPVARLDVSERTKGIMNAVSIGILTFLFYEILHGALEPTEHAIELVAEGGSLAHLGLVAAVVGGFSVGLVGLSLVERTFASRVGSTEKNTSLALMIAVGLGFHNFSEGLAIGQSAASGAMSLAFLLIVGFALHNVTEGFGIAAPLANERVSFGALAGMGLVAGGPTFLGTMIGRAWTSQLASVLALALAAGALLYVIEQLFGVTRRQLSKTTVFASVAVGFFLAFGTELVLELAMHA